MLTTLREGKDTPIFSMKIEELFEAEIGKLVAKLLWGISFGVGSGSRVALEFGQKIERSEPVRQSSPKLGEDETFYDGELSLLIENCAWRLSSATAVLCTWRSSNQKGAEMERALAQIKHTIVEAVKIGFPAGDVSLALSGGFKLDCFADCADDGNDGDNLTFFSTTHAYTIKPKGHLVCERRNDK